jgi:formiminotetrahydrofolate cyclodeaminase
MLADLTIHEFLEKTASHAPVPGGGSVAALSAALAASLTEMVANLTIGKKGYQEVEHEMIDIAKNTHLFRKNLVQYIDNDADAYNEVMTAFKLPRDTEEEKNLRKKAIQEQLKQAALIPLSVAKDAAKLLELSAKVVEKGNKNAVTDGAVAAMMARTAVLSALYNVKINLNSIKDEEFVGRVSKQVQHIEADVIVRENEILSLVDL